jgi:hypothetical protein
LVQAFLKKWWVQSDFKAPNLPLSLQFKGSCCHYKELSDLSHLINTTSSKGNPTNIQSKLPNCILYLTAQITIYTQGRDTCTHTFIVLIYKIIFNIYRIKGILFSILSLLGPLSGEPDRVSQMIVLIKTVSNTNSPLFCLSVIYIQKSLKRWKKDFFAVTEKILDLNSIYFHAKSILFWDYFFLAYFSLWSVIHSNRACYIISWTMNVMSQGVIFTVPQICAYFMDNPNNLEIDSFKIAVSEHILLYFKNSNSFFFCVHMIMCGTCCVCCVSSHGVLSFSTGKHSTYFHRICVFIHILR